MSIIEKYIKRLYEAKAYGLDAAPSGSNLKITQTSSRPSLPIKKPDNMSRIDKRMAELDRHLKDDSLKLSIGPTGKFQFVSKAIKQSANPAQITAIQKAPAQTPPPLNPPVAGQLSKSDQQQLTRYGNVIPLDKPTEIKPPPTPANRDYSSPRAQRNMKIATTALDVITSLSGVGGLAKTILKPRAAMTATRVVPGAAVVTTVGKKFLPKIVDKVNKLRVGKVDGDAQTIDYTSIPGLAKKPVPFNQIGINRGLITKTSK